MNHYVGALAWLYDWQTLVGALSAGFLAIGGAALAYYGALRQVGVIRAQMQQEREAAAARDVRERKRLNYGLGVEAARIRMLAQERLGAARVEYGEGKPSEVHPDRARAYKIEAGALRSLDVELFGPKLTNGAMDLVAKIDQLNSGIDVDGALGRLQASELIRRLEAADDSASALQASLGEEPAAEQRSRRRLPWIKSTRR
jgi:hypothetical protein